MFSIMMLLFIILTGIMKTPFYFSNCLYLIFSLLAGFSYSQEPDTVKAEIYFQEGDSLLALAKYDVAIESYEAALDIYSSFNRPLKELASLNRIVACYARLNRLEEARNVISNPEEYLNSIGPSMEVSDMYNIKGIIEFLSGNYQQALDYTLITKELRIQLYGDTSITVAKADNNIGSFYIKLGKYDLAEEVFLEVIDIYRENSMDSTLNMANTYLNIANIYQEIGIHEKALGFYTKTLTIRENLLPAGHPEIAVVYDNIGNVLQNMGEPRKALEYHEIALNFMKESFGELHPEVSRVIGNIGLDYYLMGDFDSAIKYIKSSLSTIDDILEDDHDELSSKKLSLGLIYIELGRFSEAQAYLTEALNDRKNKLGVESRNLKIAEVEIAIGRLKSLTKEYQEAEGFLANAIAAYEAYDLGSSRLAEAYLILAGIFQNTKDSDRAMEAVQKSLIANAPSFGDSTNFYMNPSGELCYDRLVLLESLYTKAQLFIADKVKENDSYAMETLLQCDELIELIRSYYTKNADKEKLGETSRKIYSTAVDFALSQYKKKKDSKYLNYVLRFIERSKFPVLKEALSKLAAKESMAIPDSIKKTENDLKARLSYYQTKLLSDQDSADLERNQQKMFETSRSMDKIKNYLASNFPDYYNQLYHVKKDDLVTKMQANISVDQTVLEFLDRDSTMLIISITKERSKIIEFPISTSLEDQLNAMEDHLRKEEVSEYAQIAYDLYRQIFEPLEIETDEVIIIPDGRVWHINFDLLLTESAEELQFGDLPYLIYDFSISYSHSFDQILKVGHDAKKSAEVLAFSYSDTDQSTTGSNLSFSQFRNDLSEIPGARQEIRAIAEIMDGKYYYGSGAIEKIFKRDAQNFGVLHLALHGVIDTLNSLNSYLLFKQGSDSLEDDRLYNFELYNMTLNANLAVLSACNTGTGEVHSAEGVMSLARAFAYAGCDNLILSRWELSDEITPRIIKPLYESLREGLRPSKALREAKLRYLASSDQIASNPYYWASLTHIGDDSQIRFKHDLSRYYLFIGVLVLILTFVFWNNKRRIKI